MKVENSSTNDALTKGVTSRQLHAIALGHAKAAGESAPGNIKAVKTTHGESVSLIYPGIPRVPMNNTPVYFITMTGQFTAYRATPPAPLPGKPPVPLPTGTRLQLVVDMKGHTLDFGVNNLPLPNLAPAGPVIELGDA